MANINWYRTGTVTVTSGAKSVAGAGTNWLSQVMAGDLFFITDSNGAVTAGPFEIESVSADAALTIKTAWPNASASGSAYAIVRNFTGTLSSDLAAKVAKVLNQAQLGWDEFVTLMTSSGQVTLTTLTGETITTAGLLGYSDAVPNHNAADDAHGMSVAGRTILRGDAAAGRGALGLANHQLVTVDASGNTAVSANLYVGSAPSAGGKIVSVRDASATGSNQSFGGILLNSAPGTDFIVGKYSNGSVGSYQLRTGAGVVLHTVTETGRHLFGAVSDDGLSDIQAVVARVAGGITRANIGSMSRGSSASFSVAAPAGNYWICVARLSYMANITARINVVSQNHEEVLCATIGTTYLENIARLEVSHQSYDTRTQFVGISAAGGGAEKYLWVNVNHSSYAPTINCCFEGEGFIACPGAVVADGAQPEQRVLVSLLDVYGGADASTRTAGKLYVSAGVILPDCASDSAAATAGVPIGGMYRTGSTPKIRAA